MSQNKLNSYLNLGVTFLERLFIIIIISTLLARIRVSVNWLYYLVKWLMIIPCVFLMTIGFSLVITFIVVLSCIFLNLFVDINELPILLNSTLDNDTILDFFMFNFYLTIPLTLIFHKLFNSVSRNLGLELFAKTRKQINNCQDNDFKDLVAFIFAFIFPILKWSV